MNKKNGLMVLLSLVSAGLGTQYMEWSLNETLLVVALLFGAYLTKSITKFLTSLFLSVLMFSFLLKLLSLAFLATPLNGIGLVFPVLVIVFFIWITRSWDYHGSLINELISIASALIVFLLAFQDGLTKPGGSIAALFQQEDNAAWVLASSRVANTTEHSVGIFGPFVDVLFFLSNKISVYFFQNLGQADHLANAITFTYILIPVFLPFLCNAAIIRNKHRKSDGLNLLVLQTGITIIWFHFHQAGHLTAGLASTGLLLVLVRTESLRTNPDKNKTYSRIALIVFLIVIGQTWFPLIPLTVALMLAMGNKRITPAGARRLSVVVCSILGSIFLIVTEALPRFSTFRDENGGLFSGAANLLLMEGGAAGTDPISVVIALLIVVGVSLHLSSTNELDIAGLVPMIYMWTFLFLIKITNVYLTNGTVNYGVRKIESMMILVSFVYCLWMLTMAVNVLHKSKTHSLLVGIAAFSLMFQLPVAQQLVGRDMFPGLKNSRNLIISQAISNTISNGVSSVCINEQREDAAFSELRMVAYVCSRFVSAYGNNDDLQKNEWRRAVLGQIRYEELPKVKEGLGDDVILIRIGPANSDLTNNVDWTSLVNPDWRQVLAND